MDKKLYHIQISSSFGHWEIASDGISLLHLKLYDPIKSVISTDEHPLLQEAKAQLNAYFDGKLHDFNLPLSPQGTTFQKRVWAELGKVPYGTTVSYSHLARQLGDPLSLRAVGTANGQNPLAVMIPCHRVIGADGSMTGYAYGIALKKQLLQHELHYRPRPVDELF